MDIICSFPRLFAGLLFGGSDHIHDVEEINQKNAKFVAMSDCFDETPSTRTNDIHSVELFLKVNLSRHQNLLFQSI